MKKIFVFLFSLFLMVGFYTPNAKASDERTCDQYLGVNKILWDGSELVKGQIGRLTILSDTSLFKVEGEKQVLSRKLKRGETYRIYAFKPGMLSVGGGFYVNRDDKVKYTTPSKTKLKAVECIAQHAKTGNMTALDLKVQKIIREIIKPNMTDFDKIYAIHDYIVYHVEYDLENYFNNRVPYSDYTAEGALFNGLAVCSGYAEATSLLLNKAGIENRVVVGSANGLATDGSQEWGGHAWNMVKLNGKYYHMDTTWDDNGEEYEVGFNYFLVSTKKLSSDHEYNEKIYPKTDNKFDQVFSENRVLYKGTEGLLLVSGADEENINFKITKITNNGEITYPFTKIKMSAIFDPIIVGNYIFYAKEVYDESTSYSGHNLHRVSTNGENDIEFIKGISSAEYYNKHLYYVQNNTDPIENSWNGSIYRVSLDHLQTHTLILKENTYIDRLYISEGTMYYSADYEQKEIKLKD